MIQIFGIPIYMVIPNTVVQTTNIIEKRYKTYSI